MCCCCRPFFIGMSMRCCVFVSKSSHFMLSTVLLGATLQGC
jgi:hypothetical protein